MFKKKSKTSPGVTPNKCEYSRLKDEKHSWDTVVTFPGSSRNHDFIGPEIKLQACHQCKSIRYILEFERKMYSEYERRPYLGYVTKELWFEAGGNKD